MAHGYRGLRHQPDRTARQITTNLVSTRIITGDVARLAGFGEKEGRKEFLMLNRLAVLAVAAPRRLAGLACLP